MENVCQVQNNAKHLEISLLRHIHCCEVFFAFGDCSPLAYDAVLIDNLLLTCQRSLMPPPSGQLNKSQILGEVNWLQHCINCTVQKREFVC